MKVQILELPAPESVQQQVAASYTMTEGADGSVFRTVLYRTGTGSALNALVYNKDLSALLWSAGLAGAVFVGGRSVAAPQTFSLLLALLVFAAGFMALKRLVFADRVTEIHVKRSEGRVVVTMPGRWSGRQERSVSISEIRLLEVVEDPPLDESEIGEIVKWHRLAEPGVHATPLPVIRLNMVLSDESRILVYTDMMREGVEEVRRRLGGALGLA